MTWRWMWVSLVAALAVSGCEDASSPDDDRHERSDDDDGEKPRRGRRARASQSAMPLGEIEIRAPRSEGDNYEVDEDAVLQVLALVAMDALPVTAVKDGYRVDAVPEGSLLAMAGFVRGDVVTHVTGIPIMEAEVIRKAYASMRALKVVAITVRRKGETKVLGYEVRGRLPREVPRRARRSPRRRSKKAPPELLAGVTEVKPHRFTVSRKALALLADPETALSRARILPSRDRDGVRLFGIRRASTPDIFGFENGDRVTKINGTPLTGLATAMKAFEALDADTKTVVEVVRKERSLTLEYTVVDP